MKRYISGINILLFVEALVGTFLVVKAYNDNLLVLGCMLVWHSIVRWER